MTQSLYNFLTLSFFSEKKLVEFDIYTSLQIAHQHFQNGNQTYTAYVLEQIPFNGLRQTEEFYLYGYLSLELNLTKQALPALEKALSFDPQNASTHLLLGIAYRRTKKFKKAIRSLKSALRQQPSWKDASYNLALTYEDDQQYELAIRLLKKMLKNNPDDADLLNLLAGNLSNIGQTKEAILIYQKVIELDPNFTPFRFNLSQVLLQLEQWEEGWSNFEFRLSRGKKPPNNSPSWRGEPLEGKSILIWAEQGYGDTFQFLQFLSDIDPQKVETTLLVPNVLSRLLSDNLSNFKVITKSDIIPKTDFQLPLMSLPHHLGMGSRFKTPYLKANLSEKEHLREKAPDLPVWDKMDGQLKVGLVWAGNPNHPDDARRSIKGILFKPLLLEKNAQFYALQLGKRKQQLQQKKLIDLEPFLSDFSDTAIFIDQLDLVISVDTAVAHLAGGMGKNVWLLLDQASDWRWGLDREDTIWYSNMRLFRQEKAGDWEHVIQEVKKALQKLIRK